MIALIIDSVVSLVIGFIAAAIPIRRYHNRITLKLYNEKYQYGSKQFDEGWDKGSNYVLAYDIETIETLKKHNL